MIKKTIMILMIFSAMSSFAANNSNKVAVLYNGKTQINRNTLHFMGTEFKKQGSSYQFQAVTNAKDIKPGIYKAILVLNTGASTGIDPVLSKFINSWDNKSEIVLLTLQKGSKNFIVETVPKDKNDVGVDVITSASKWNRAKKMHQDWVTEALKLIGSKE